MTRTRTRTRTTSRPGLDDSGACEDGNEGGYEVLNKSCNARE